MSEFSVSLAKLADEANLTTAFTPCDLKEIKVTASEVYRPGIFLAGYYQYFDCTRIQIFGLTEMSYLEELEPEMRCLLYTSPSPRDYLPSRMPSSA